VYVVQIATVAMPEIADLRFQVDQFNAMRKTMVYMLNVFMMDAVTLDEARLHLVKKRLLNTRQLGVSQQVSRHGGARYTVPEPGRTCLG